MAWKPIIVGVDHSPESHQAARVAAQLAHAARALLVPVHAVPVVPVFTGLAGIEPMPVFSPELQGRLTTVARAQVERELADALPDSALRRLELPTGPAPTLLAEVARTRKAELVVLGGKQHGALARGLGRSTAHYLVRTLDVPLLVVTGSVTSIARVLVAVDLSITSEPTVVAAERFARLFGARLRLLHVVEPIPFAQLVPDQWDEGVWARRSQEMFDRFASRFKTVAPEDRVVRRGVAAETIAEEASAWRADVLVVGSHGKGWVDRILVGSTTERLVTELPTSIIVVPVKAKRPAKRRARTRHVKAGRA